MNRDGYTAPSGQSNPHRPSAATGTMWYQCADCGSRVSINKGEHIRCKECGHRVLYKERTKRMVQFEAR
ncbi:DNA-directed RNA polymerases I, II, and III subunit RPABC4 [Terfezia claveryi]|nr:DNA-directed RNA polymerases I, II, and III subunit RPABC4 [Terfezia claveryi]